MDATEAKEFVSKLSQADQNELARLIVQNIRNALRSEAFSRLAMQTNLSEVVLESLGAITAKTGASQDDALLMALTLYDVAIDALRQGLRLVLVDKDYRFVREVTGLVEETPENSLHEKVAS